MQTKKKQTRNTWKTVHTYSLAIARDTQMLQDMPRSHRIKFRETAVAGIQFKDSLFVVLGLKVAPGYS